MEVDRRHWEFFFLFSFCFLFSLRSSLEAGWNGKSTSHSYEEQERNVLKRTEVIAQATG
jgi:hypothetical protein